MIDYTNWPQPNLLMPDGCWSAFVDFARRKKLGRRAGEWESQFKIFRAGFRAANA